MLVPLKQFICDTCYEVIRRPEEGWVEWLSYPDEKEGDPLARHFRIVHHYTYSPLIHRTHRCYPFVGNLNANHMELTYFTKAPIPVLLMWLHVDKRVANPHGLRRIKSMDAFMEFFRRLTIPYYEEARHYMAQAVADDFFEEAWTEHMYRPERLRGVIQKYKPREVKTAAGHRKPRPAPALRLVVRGDSDEQEA